MQEEETILALHGLLGNKILRVYSTLQLELFYKLPSGRKDRGNRDYMSADVARGHGGNRGKGTRKPNLGGRRAGRQHTRQETRNLGLKAITDKSGPVPIRFEVDDRETLMPLGDHAAHWANYLGELVRKLPLHYPSWRQMPPERKAGVVAKIGNSLWVRVVKALHGEDEKIGKKLGNEANTSLWDVAWCGDIAFKNLVPRLYALESMKNIEVASKLSHGVVVSCEMDTVEKTNLS
nr:hypothetical protein [Tanacetum cinerariifolium]